MSWPFAIAAVCAAVGFGYSAGSSPGLSLVLEDEDGEDDSELLLLFNLLVRLQAATTMTRRIINGRFFIEFTSSFCLFEKLNGRRLLL